MLATVSTIIISPQLEVPHSTRYASVLAGGNKAECFDFERHQRHESDNLE